MQTFTECIPCFERQIEKLSTLAARIYAQAAKVSGQNDFFAQHKHTANTKVLELLPALEECIQASPDCLLTALRFSLIANSIDVGVDAEFDWEAALTQEKSQEETGGYFTLRQMLDAGKNQVMILRDNAGEIGMDTLLVKQLRSLGAEVSYVPGNKELPTI